MRSERYMGHPRPSSMNREFKRGLGLRGVWSKNYRKYSVWDHKRQKEAILVTTSTKCTQRRKRTHTMERCKGVKLLGIGHKSGRKSPVVTEAFYGKRAFSQEGKESCKKVSNVLKTFSLLLRHQAQSRFWEDAYAVSPTLVSIPHSSIQQERIFWEVKQMQQEAAVSFSVAFYCTLLPDV